MTDYLEEHLGSAEALLKRIRQLEQNAYDLPLESISEKNMGNSDEFAENEKEKSYMVSYKSADVYDTKQIVNQQDNIVDEPDAGRMLREKGPEPNVNCYTRQDYDREDPAQTGAEGAESRSPLSVQLEELDRTVSAPAALIPAGQERATGGYPVSLSQGPAIGPNVTSVPGGAWSGPGTAAGAGLAYGGERSWAEQADRMFRRDSRRYDGGFYLY